jgi:serine/threonine protein kinase/outer membrane protein assembly factor BamB
MESRQPSSSPESDPAAKIDLPDEPTCDHLADAATELVMVLDQYLLDLKAGKPPSRQTLMAQHPALASQLDACLAGLEFIHRAESTGPGKSQVLGDFRIIREVGRGGMGTVFEAEQISLGRSVALKILRYGAVSDPESIERFKREAETVAKLHHTNIVPIFNVGSEHGVNYYAMQFIDGRSLAQVLAEKQEPIETRRVAEWGLQAAEALSHAHQRGVIHRDVKPSNLLLDQECRLWLTDFGLARRMDDVTLSITGAILGTPRYMSPEQARAAHKSVDHRSDLFSLGASLYELLTAQPAFPGESPHAVLQGILHGDPLPVKQLAPSVPRDLETIVMKCLSKEAGNRYANASELAADLRAFLDGRQIRARRTSWGERAARWVKRQQQSVKLASAAVGVTLLVILGSILGWYAFDVWRQASIKLNAVNPPLVVEIFDNKDRLVKVETAPMQNALSVPSGDYRVRVSAEGELSETFDMPLLRGSDSEFTLDLHDQLLWTPRDVERSFDVVDFGTDQGVVLWNEKGLGLRRYSPQLSWTRELAVADLPDPSSSAGFRWPWNEAWQSHSGYGPFDTRPWVASCGADIDGRGQRDFIVAARHQAWLMAISGEDGGVLWFVPRGDDLANLGAVDGNAVRIQVQSGILGSPLIGSDLDADGTPDVIATMADIGPTPQMAGSRSVARCWVEALSGKTGDTLWSFEIPRDFFELPPGEEVPYDLRWFAGAFGGTTSSGGGILTQGRHRFRDAPTFQRTGLHAYRPASVQMIRVSGQDRLAIVAGTQFLSLDPVTGQAIDQPFDLEARPGRTCQWADMDGDGNSDLVLLERSKAAKNKSPKNNPSNFGNASNSTTCVRLVTWSVAERKQLWAKELDARWPQQPTWTVESPPWPLVVDLDGNHQCEVVVPHGSSSDGTLGWTGGFSSIPWGALEVLDGPTGQSLWTRRLVTIDQQVDRFVVGPDLDGDGYREIFTATLVGKQFSLYVDALSGKQGTTLWTQSLEMPPDRNSSVEYCLAQPIWWQAGEDGWPQLITQVVEGDPGNRRSLIGLVSAGTGRVTRLGHNVTSLLPADVDGDGTQDLIVFDSKSSSALDLGGRLHCLRGVANEIWAKLGDTGDPLGDLDGDGTQDLVSGFPRNTLTATSGASGQILWRSKIVEDARPFHVRAADARRLGNGDLNGDGFEDLLGWTDVAHRRRLGNPFFALSGKTGKRLWTAAEISAQMFTGVLSAEAHDLDSDGRPEVLCIAALDYGYPLRAATSSLEAQLWLFVISGQTGKLQWAHALSPAYGQSPGNALRIDVAQNAFSPAVGDLNGDGTNDILVPSMVPDGTRLETLALNGSDGSSLWSLPFPTDPRQQLSLKNWVPPTVCDLEGDGKSEVVIVGLDDNPLSSNQPILPKYKVVAVRGDSASEVWHWLSTTPSEQWQPYTGESIGELMRPRLLRAGGESQRAAVLLPGSEGVIVVFGPDGAIQHGEANYQTSRSGIWVCDGNRDGVDELLFLDGGALCMTPVDRLDEPLWKTDMGPYGEPRIRGILSGSQDLSPVIVVSRDGTDNSVLGYLAATGHRVWSCPGVVARDPEGGTYLVPRQVVPLDTDAMQPPHIYFSYGAVSRCRQATVSPETEFEMATSRSAMAEVLQVQSTASAASVSRPSKRGDDRWARDLPWVQQRPPVRETLALVFWSLVFALLLVVLPIGFLVSLMLSKRFSLQTVLTLPIVVSLFLTACLIQAPTERDFDDVTLRLLAGVLFSPVIVASGLTIAWCVNGQWRRILLWFGLTWLSSGLFAAVVLWIADRQNPQIPEVYYDVSGWYLIGLIGVYLASWGLLMDAAFRSLVQWRVQRQARESASAISALN